MLALGLELGMIQTLVKAYALRPTKECFQKSFSEIYLKVSLYIEEPPTCPKLTFDR